MSIDLRENFFIYLYINTNLDHYKEVGLENKRSVWLKEKRVVSFIFSHQPNVAFRWFGWESAGISKSFKGL